MPPRRRASHPQHLTLAFSYNSPLLARHRAPELLSHQALAHSFLLQRGVGSPLPSSTFCCFAHFALRYLVCFHANPNCPFCKSFVLITIQIAGGGGDRVPLFTFPFSCYIRR